MQQMGLGNFGRGQFWEYACEIILNSVKWSFKLCVFFFSKILLLAMADILFKHSRVLCVILVEGIM